MDAMGAWVCSCRAYGLLMTIDLYWLLLTCTFRLLEVGKLNLNTCSKLQARKGVDSENTCGASLTLMAGTKSVGTRNAMMAKGVTPTWKRSCIDWKHCPFVFWYVRKQLVAVARLTNWPNQPAFSTVLPAAWSACTKQAVTSSGQNRFDHRTWYSGAVQPEIPVAVSAKRSSIYMIFTWYLHDCWILLDMFHVFSMRWQPTPLQLHTQSQPQVATQNFWRNCHKNPHSNQHQ